MAAAAVGVDQYGIYALECCVILGPAEIMYLGLDPLDFIEAFLQEQGSGTKFMVAWAVARAAGDEQDFFVSGKTAPEPAQQEGGGQQCIFYGRVHAGRKPHFGGKIKPKIAWPSAEVRVGCPTGLAGCDMFWGTLIGVLVVGVIGADMIFDMEDPDFLANTLKEIAIGGGIGVAVGLALFVYVAGLVYGMSTANGRKTLMGLGLLTLLLGLGSFSYPLEGGAILPLHLLVGLFVTPEPGEDLVYSWVYGIPYLINGGLMCKLGSFNE